MNQDLYVNLRYEELLREANMERLANKVVRPEKTVLRYYRSILAALGRNLIALGHKLQVRYSQVQALDEIG